MKESYLFLADGFELIEAITPIDVLRRAGIPVKTVSITASLQVMSAQGVTVTADVLFDNTLFVDAPWLILPGGMPGATNLYEFAPLHGVLKNQVASEHGRIASICASPAVVLGQMGLLKGHKATCYPGFESYLVESQVLDTDVVVDGKFVLANGPANALSWAFTILSETIGNSKAEKIANDMLLYPRSKETDYYFG